MKTRPHIPTLGSIPFACAEIVRRNRARTLRKIRRILFLRRLCFWRHEPDEHTLTIDGMKITINRRLLK